MSNSARIEPSLIDYSQLVDGRHPQGEESLREDDSMQQHTEPSVGPRDFPGARMGQDKRSERPRSSQMLKPG